MRFFIFMVLIVTCSATTEAAPLLITPSGATGIHSLLHRLSPRDVFEDLIMFYLKNGFVKWFKHTVFGGTRYPYPWETIGQTNQEGGNGGGRGRGSSGGAAAATRTQ